MASGTLFVAPRARKQDVIIVLAVAALGCAMPFLLKADDAWKDWNDRFMAALAALIAAELACLALIAALPLDHWLDSLHARSPESWNLIVAKLKTIPSEMHYYFKLHGISLIAGVLLHFLEKSVVAWPDKGPTDAFMLFSGPVLRWAILGGLAALNTIAVWQVFALMRFLTGNAFKRFEVVPGSAAPPPAVPEQREVANAGRQE